MCVAIFINSTVNKNDVSKLEANLWSNIVWVCRYSKGGISLTEIKEMTVKEFISIKSALNDLIMQENEASKGK